MGGSDDQAYYEAVPDGDEKHGKGQNYQMPENPTPEVLPPPLSRVLDCVCPILG